MMLKKITLLISLPLVASANVLPDLPIMTTASHSAQTCSINKDCDHKKGTAPISHTITPRHAVFSNDVPLRASSQVSLKPGMNEVLPIALGHANRIVTPFSSPKVIKMDSSTTIDIKDNVLYVATENPAPITLYIRDAGSESVALSITLVPRRIPPQQYELNIKGQQHYNFSNKKAQRWEESQPYIESLRLALRDTALGKVPSGYSLGKTQPNDALPHCAQPGLSFSFNGGQTIAGHHFKILVGTVHNATPNPIELKESSCGNWNVAAVAAWPNVFLTSGQSSEIYVVMNMPHQSFSQESQRPSLLEQGGDQHGHI
ncbi:TraK domain-containing protein [Piscirickettsia litoralis]|nr:type-F conjugative transfer system secretin TraK [Piscirickettsia litoralis]